MAGYLIFLPGRRGGTVQHLRDVGLAALLAADDPGPSFADVLENGPDGGGGLLAFWDDTLHPDRTPRPQILRETQTWEPAKPHGDLAAGRFWLGCETDRPVRPCDLERRRMQPGADVLLADGQAWHVPIARQLPCVLGLDDQGRVASQMKNAYVPFYESAWKTLEQFDFSQEGKASIDHACGFDFAAQALGINYRLNRDVADFLKIIDTSALWEIPKAVCEFEALVEHAQKKTAAALRSIAAGAPA